MAQRGDAKKRMVGQVARSGNHTVRSYQVGAMPILGRIFDRIGRCLDRLFRTDVTALVMDVVRHVVQEFDLSLEELHNGQRQYGR